MLFLLSKSVESQSYSFHVKFFLRNLLANYIFFLVSKFIINLKESQLNNLILKML